MTTTTTARTTQSTRLEHFLKRGTSILVAIVFVASGLLSFNHLTTLALQHGAHPLLAWLFPVAVDGAILAGTFAVLHYTQLQRRPVLPYAFVILGSAITILANVATASSTHFFSYLVAASPAVLFICVVEVQADMVKRSVTDLVAQQKAEQQRAEEERCREAERREREERRREREEEAALAAQQAALFTPQQQPQQAPQQPESTPEQPTEASPATPAPKPTQKGTPSRVDLVHELLLKQPDITPAQVVEQLADGTTNKQASKALTSARKRVAKAEAAASEAATVQQQDSDEEEQSTPTPTPLHRKEEAA